MVLASDLVQLLAMGEYCILRDIIPDKFFEVKINRLQNADYRLAVKKICLLALNI